MHAAARGGGSNLGGHAGDWWCTVATELVVPAASETRRKRKRLQALADEKICIQTLWCEGTNEQEDFLCFLDLQTSSFRFDIIARKPSVTSSFLGKPPLHQDSKQPKLKGCIRILCFLYSHACPLHRRLGYNTTSTRNTAQKELNLLLGVVHHIIKSFVTKARLSGPFQCTVSKTNLLTEHQ